MKIFLTGGNGFIGKNILESFLSEKYEILAPRSFELNLTDQDSVNEFFKQHKVDIVIHAACKPGHRNAKDTSNLFFTNTQMFYNLLKHQDKYNKLINLGSGAIYDMRNYQPKMKEEYFGTHIPVDEHGFCKYVIGKHIEHLDNVVDLRIFGIFGRYEDYAIRFISNAICKTLFDLPVTLKQNRKFDYIYVDDLMPILDYFIENKGQYSSYNVTPDKSIELYKLAEKVIEISGKNLPVLVDQPGLGLEYSGDNARLHNEIKNLKFPSIDKSIEKLYKWYSDNINLIDKEILLVDK